MESEPMLTSREKSPLPEKFSIEEGQTHDAASSRAVSPTHYQQAISTTADIFELQIKLSASHPVTPGQPVPVLTL